MSKKKVLLRGVFINRDTNGEGVLKVGTTLIRVSTVMGILYSDVGFEFAHTSYIVNMQKIVSVVKDDILMSNKQFLRISRTCKQKFHEKFSYYFSKKYRRVTDK